MQGLRVRIATPVRVCPSGRVASADNWTSRARTRSGPEAADVVEQGPRRAHQADGGRDELAADRRSIADQVEQLAAGLRPHDRLVGRTQRREHPPQLFLLLLGPRLLVGTVEAAERKGDVVGEPLQQLGEFGREGVALGGDEQHHADRLVVDDQRKRRAGSRILAVDDFAERAVGDVAEEIVVDAGAPGAERLAADAAPFRRAHRCARR